LSLGPTTSMGLSHIAVVLLNWNGWRDTIRCLESLLVSDQVAFRIVVVDNGSTDGSADQVREWAAVRIATTTYDRNQALAGGIESEEAKVAMFPRSLVLVLNGDNVGFGAGNNVGLSYALARGFDAVWVLNNDTTVDSGCLASMLRAIESGPHIGAAGCVTYQMDHPHTVQLWGGAHVDMVLGIALHIMSLSASHRLNMLSGVSVLLRADALREIGLFDENFFMYWEDADLSFRLRSAGWALRVAPEARIWHRESSSLGGRTNRDRDHYYNESLEKFFLKHSWLPAVPICLGLTARRAKRVLAAILPRTGEQND
jgi:GT2 family glycosyltransferase